MAAFATDNTSLPGPLEALVSRYTQEADDRKASRILEDLFSTYGLETVRRAVGRVVSRSSNLAQDDAEDLRGEVCLNLVMRLKRWREDRKSDICSLRAYAETVAKNAANSQSNRDRPLRTKLAANIRYALSSTPELAAWKGERGTIVAGLSAWDSETLPYDSDFLQALIAHPAQLINSLQEGEYLGSLPLRTLLRRLFECVGHPVAVSTAVNLIAAARGVVDTPAALESQFEDSSSLQDKLIDPHADAEVCAIQREYLRALWDAIHGLPRNHRAALLLNLRDPLGRGVIALLPEVGIASKSEIALAVGMPIDELEQRWDDLPMDDASIAVRYGLSATQVVSLRRNARARLGRGIAA